jgi:AraC-like DNA-binding protein
MSTIFTERLFARFAAEFRPHLSAVGLDESIFTVPDMEIPIDVCAELLERVADVDDPAIALRMGREMEPTDLGVLGHAMLAARDVQQMLETLSCFIYVVVQEKEIRLDLSRERAVVSYRFLAQDAGPYRRDVEYSVCAIAKCIDAAVVRAIRPQRVEFEHARPEYARAYSAAFDCPVHFERGGNRLHYDRSTMHLPVASRDQRLYEALHFFLEDKLKSRKQDDDLLGKLRHLVATSLHAGLPQLAGVARQLGLSERTLQRRLAEQGIVFNELVDGTRKAIALEYLRDRRYRLIDIAQIVGYSEASSFTRACRRWTDKSPTELRKHRSAAAWR